MAQPTAFGNYRCIVTDIDRKEYRERIVPMRVLSLGLPRTGTDSTTTALRMLGVYECYPGFQAILNNPRDNEMWMEALEAKFNGKGVPYGRKEWDKLLGHCQGVSDVPAILFAEELIAAYPDAKVILTHRDFDSWYRSISQNLEPFYNHPLIRHLIPVTNSFRLHTRWTRPVMRKSWEHLSRGDFASNARAVHKEHYEKIRTLVPAENILEYRVQDGWGPLIKFLGVPHPQREFPNTNDKDEFHRRFKAALLKLSLWYIGERILMGFLGFLLLAWLLRRSVSG